MLTTCPECSLQVSDKATICPHCGYPLQSSQKYPSNRKKPPKRRRLPNGFGQISEIKSQYLRKPFRAMVTVGKTDTGKPICKLLQPEAYFATYNEAYEALIKYHSGDYNPSGDITIGELYTLWSEEHFKHLSKNRISAIRSHWKKCKEIEKIKVRDFRPYAITQFLDSIDNPLTRQNIKSILNQMYDYAVNNEICSRNYARSVRIRVDMPETNHHKSFTDDEMKILWENINDDTVKAMLIMCYSGWRPGEFISMTKENINVKDMYFTGGSKTKDGMNRKVPIHSAIQPLVKYLYKNANDTILDVGYDQFRRRMIDVCKNLNINSHLPHDCRKQFVTMAKKYKVDEYAIKRLVGHHISDITESVYTDRDFEWLRYEIEKIKVYE